MTIKIKNKQLFKNLLPYISSSLGPDNVINPNVDLENFEEVENVKSLFLQKKLGVDLNNKNTEIFYKLLESVYPKIINRTILYCMLTEAFDKSSIFLKENDDFIFQDININNGRPTVKGTRISVGMILEKMASGDTIQEILEAYPHLSKEQIEATIKYGAKIVNEQMII